MAIPIAITGSYNFQGLTLTGSYATVKSITTEYPDYQVSAGSTDFSCSINVHVYLDSSSFVLQPTTLGFIDAVNFSTVLGFDEGDMDPFNQAYNFIVSASDFSGMTKKIYS